MKIGLISVSGIVLFLLLWFVLFREKGTLPEPEMVLIPAGLFQMGRSEGYPNEKPAHPVKVSAFRLSKYETTVAQFRAFTVASGYKTDAEKEGEAWGYDGSVQRQIPGRNWRHDPEGNTAKLDHPVIYVSWNDATEYAKWLAQKTEKKYRLPTEAEWEYAAGNGIRHTRYSWGNDTSIGKKGGNLRDEATKRKFPYPYQTIFKSYDDGYVFTAPVGSFDANDFDLHDMTGNVCEWVQDVWHDNYSSAPSDGSAWLYGGDRSLHCTRGGAWDHNANVILVPFRNLFYS
jgi:formylglycine-generating enzyme required for sulfatase activity